MDNYERKLAMLHYYESLPIELKSKRVEEHLQEYKIWHKKFINEVIKEGGAYLDDFAREVVRALF